MMRPTALRILVGAASAVLALIAGPAHAQRVDTRIIHERAIEQPFDEHRFQAYLGTLPREGDYYVVEGDLAMTSAEVRAYLSGLSQAETRAGISPELVVNVHQGERDFYAAVPDRRLAYYVDKASFTSGKGYELALTAVRQAAKEWQGICPECQINFVELEAAPSGPAAKTGFVVRQQDSGGSYVALAFFPHDPPARRVLRVDPIFFNSQYDPVGVFRHELGHVLGYRHEHIRGIPGCGFEDNRWQPLTPYDPHSVMHYFCGGGGSLRFALSEIDVAGHRSLYGRPQTAALASLTKPPPISAAAEQALQRFEDARQNPFDEAKRRAYLAQLPRVGDYFILEGDLRMTEQEVIAHLISGQKETTVDRRPELLVNLFRGTPDFYPPDQRKLSYVIDRSSFKTQDQYDRAAKAIEQATMEWETVCGECGLDFTHLKEQDGQPAAANANFTVRMVDAGGQFIASAFFPHDPPARRVLEVDPSFYDNAFDPVGVFRHELGHVLGYRHEHIRGVSGCFQEGNSWRPLTPYDPKSVMHYFCGSGGSLKLEFSQYDRIGHRRLYGLQKAAARAIPSAPPQPAGVLVVSLQGGEVVDNAAAVLRVLNELKALPIQSHTIAEGERVESVYRQRLNLPGFSAAMAKFANALNGPNFAQKPLSIGEKVRYPAIQFSEGSFGIRADAVKAAEIEQNWKGALTHPKQTVASPTAGAARRVELRAYELRIPFANSADLERARDRIADLKSENIVVGTETPPPAGGAKYFSSGFQDGGAPPASYTTLDKVYSNRTNLAAGEQGAVLSLLGATTLPGKPACVGVACPEIVLIDKPLVMHPDLKDAIPGEEPDRSYENEALIVGGRQSFEVLDWNDAYHATHLAGIIGARDNGFGLVGVDPDARITWWNWDKLSTALMTVAKKVSDRQADADSRGSFQIYMFATSWPTGVHNSRASRMNDGLAKRFVQERPLVVAAAGEADPLKNEQPQDVTFSTAEAPMNLGDQENVIIVTGCSPCVAPSAQLLANANMSSSFVHVAAPARDVLSTASGAKYTKGSGTSQATAFVAGLASAMVSRFPDIYKDAAQVKVRLQATSMPIELIGDPSASDKLATGVIDPSFAILDPRKYWLKTGGGDPEPYDGIAWEVPSLNINVDGIEETVATKDIWRISTRDGKSVVYTGFRRGPLRKFGPGPLTAAAGTTAVCKLTVRPPNAAPVTTAVTLDKIEDLVLKYPTSAQ